MRAVSGRPRRNDPDPDVAAIAAALDVLKRADPAQASVHAMARGALDRIAQRLRSA